MFLPLLGLAALITAAYVGGRSAKMKALEAQSPPLFVPTLLAPGLAPKTSPTPQDLGEPLPNLEHLTARPRFSQASKQKQPSPPTRPSSNKIPAEFQEILLKLKKGSASAEECLAGMAWLATKAPSANPASSPFYAGLKKAKGEVEAAKILARFRAKQLEKLHRGR